MNGNAKLPAPRPRSAFLVKLRVGHLILLLLCSAIVCASAQMPAPPPRFVIVLDAAHGGDDTGAALANQSQNSQPEKTFTLALSVKLRSLLGARGFTVITTRETDTDVEQQHRAEIANHADAQACLTLHATSSGTGVHLFLSSLPPVKLVRLMPWQTAQASYVDRSIALAGMLNSTLTHAGMKVTLGRTALSTIDSMTCPAVAVEVAPETTANGEITPLDDPGYQTRVAAALSAGLLEWRSEPRQP